MSDPTDTGAELPQVAPHEELASALLDGEATADEQARADDPDVARALRAHQEVARRVASAVEPPATADRERVLAAALAAFDLGEADEPTETGGADELAARRVRPRPPQWIAAVAAALLVLAGFGLLAGLAGRGAGDDDSETAASDAAEQTTAAEGGTSADDSGGSGDAQAEAYTSAEQDSGAEVPTSAASIPHLGEYADADEAVAAARDVFVARQAAGAPTFAEAGGDATAELAVPCASALGTVPDTDVVATAIVEGELVTLLVQSSDDGATVIVFASPACEPERFEP
jgi:hypothetical protein